jgi:hypothetical protein
LESARAEPQSEGDDWRTAHRRRRDTRRRQTIACLEYRRAQAAQLSRVSRSSIADARIILPCGTLEIITAVERGELAVTSVARETTADTAPATRRRMVDH